VSINPSVTFVNTSVASVVRKTDLTTKVSKELAKVTEDYIMGFLQAELVTCRS
jgi:hypothetical protein